MWLQQHVQEFNSSPQSQMQQRRKNTNGKHTTKVQRPECNNTSTKSESLSNLARNRIHVPNTLRPNPMMPIHPQPTNVKESPASSFGNATQSVQSKLLPPKTAPCMPKRESQFSNNPDPTHNFLSTQLVTTKSTALVDTDCVSTGVQSRLPPVLMSQSMMKELAHHAKLPQVLMGAMFAQLMFDWKHCEDQQKEIVFCLFPEHWPWKQFQQSAVNQSFFAVRQASNEKESDVEPCLCSNSSTTAPNFFLQTCGMIMINFLFSVEGCMLWLLHKVFLKIFVFDSETQ